MCVCLCGVVCLAHPTTTSWRCRGLLPVAGLAAPRSSGRPTSRCCWAGLQQGHQGSTQWSPTWWTWPPLHAVLGQVLQCPGTSPPHLCLDVSKNVLCPITIPVQLSWYFGLLCCVSKSMFYLSCFCTVCWYFCLESSVNRSTMSLL